MLLGWYLFFLSDKLRFLENGWFGLFRLRRYLEGDRLGPRISATASAPRFALRSGLRSGPRAQPRHQMGFNIFDFRISWNHPRFQVFTQKYTWNHQKISKKSWNQATKKKERFLLKTTFWPVLRLFHRLNFIFTHAFYDFFTGSACFSRRLFKILSRT